jgi:hypothetical protein
VPKQALIKATPIEEGIEQQITGTLLGPETEGPTELGEPKAGTELPKEEETSDAEQGKKKSLEVTLPPEGKSEPGFRCTGHQKKLLERKRKGINGRQENPTQSRTNSQIKLR